MPDQDDNIAILLEATEDEEEQAAAPPDSSSTRRIVTEPRDLSVRELFTQEQEGDLQLQPEFQRFYVFDDIKASRLIESALIGVPLPLVYLSEDVDATLSVIDGQQRLTSFFRFLRNEFRLRGLTILTEHSRQLFKDLPFDMQRALRQSTLRCIVIKRESDPNIKFEIFERLNTGSVRLNDHELRNCIYRGRFNLLLRDLANEPEWLRLLGRAKPDNRMIDREMILRFFGLYLEMNQYRPPMKRFLSRVMEMRGTMTEPDAQNLRDLFRRTVGMVYSVFGNRAFRRYEPGNVDRHGGTWGGETRLNMALFDAVMTGFALYETRDIIPYADAIREALIDLMATDRTFIDAITLGTSERDRLLARTQIWNNRLREVINNPHSEPRFFPHSFRQQLFENDPTCSICQQQILSVDDTAVDHLIPYSLGGSTTPANGRLAHRYCNSVRGNRVTTH